MREEGKVEVEFSLPECLAENATNVFLVGDFNNWDRIGDRKILMIKEGDAFKAKCIIEMNKEYQYLYLIVRMIDTTKERIEYWEMDRYADKYIPGVLGGNNSIVITHEFPVLAK